MSANTSLRISLVFAGHQGNPEVADVRDIRARSALATPRHGLDTPHSHLSPPCCSLGRLCRSRQTTYIVAPTPPHLHSSALRQAPPESAALSSSRFTSAPPQCHSLPLARTSWRRRRKLSLDAEGGVRGRGRPLARCRPSLRLWQVSLLPGLCAKALWPGAPAAFT